MKTKIVIWGTNEQEEKILLGIDLIEAENKVNIYVFPESEATEVFYNQMINDWREGNPVVLPENHTLIERPLSVTDSLLPDNIRVSRTDVINRAKAEWHFVVLSSKLYELYKSELGEIKEKVASLQSYDKNVWEDLKTFWQKVQKQMFDKALFREHAKEIQEETNQLFDRMKEFRRTLDDKFKVESKERAAAFHEKLDTIRGKLNEGLGLQPLWNELKNIQSRFRSEKLAKQERNELWNKIDKLFKDIKEKKYGPNSGGKKNAIERIENRYNGLLAAIKKMENSIKWDKKDMKFQEDRAEGTFGQLEAELRGAKMKMIEERVKSKELKLADMMKTRAMLEGKLEVEREKLKKAEEAKEVKAREAELKAKVKEEIKEKNKILDEKMSKTGESESKEVNSTIPPVVDTAIVTPVELPSEEVVDTVAVEKSEAKSGESAEDQPTTAEEKSDLKSEVSASENDESAIDEGADEEDDRSIEERVQDVAEDIVDSAKAAVKVIKDRVSKVVENLTEEE